MAAKIPGGGWVQAASLNAQYWHQWFGIASFIKGWDDGTGHPVQGAKHWKAELLLRWIPKNWRTPQSSKAKPYLWHGQSHKPAQAGAGRKLCKIGPGGPGEQL